MNDLTQHQRDILIAMLQGRDIQGAYFNDVIRNWDWEYVPNQKALIMIAHSADNLRIAPNQPAAI